MNALEEHLSNASREELLEHISIQREVIGRLNRKLMDLEAAVEYLSSRDDGEAAHRAHAHEPDTRREAVQGRETPDRRTRGKERAAAPATARAIDREHVHPGATTGGPAAAAAAAAAAAGGKEDTKAIEKINAVLAAHQTRSPELPADIVAELLYIREQLTLPHAHRNGKAILPTQKQKEREYDASYTGPVPRGYSVQPHPPLRNSRSDTRLGIKWVSPKATRVVYGSEEEHDSDLYWGPRRSHSRHRTYEANSERVAPWDRWGPRPSASPSPIPRGRDVSLRSPHGSAQ